MSEDFVTYELAVKLKEKGFDEPCEMYYHIHDDIADCVGSLESTGGEPNFINSNNKYRCATPTISQVLKWLREEKKIYLELVIVVDGEYMCDIYKIDKRPIECLGSTEYLKTYEEAALAGIEYTLDNLI